MFSLFLRPEDTSPPKCGTSCVTPHMKHNHATLQTLHQQEPCRQEQHSLFKTKLISSIVSNHLYKCPDAYKSQTLIRAFFLVPNIGSYKHTCTVLWCHDPGPWYSGTMILGYHGTRNWPALSWRAATATCCGRLSSLWSSAGSWCWTGSSGSTCR